MLETSKEYKVALLIYLALLGYESWYDPLCLLWLVPSTLVSTLLCILAQTQVFTYLHRPTDDQVAQLHETVGKTLYLVEASACSVAILAPLPIYCQAGLILGAGLARRWSAIGFYQSVFR